MDIYPKNKWIPRNNVRVKPDLHGWQLPRHQQLIVNSDSGLLYEINTGGTSLSPVSVRGSRKNQAHASSDSVLKE